MQQQSEHGSVRKVPPGEKNQRCAGGNTALASSRERNFQVREAVRCPSAYHPAVVVQDPPGSAPLMLP
jgi:hypothetical protein